MSASIGFKNLLASLEVPKIRPTTANIGKKGASASGIALGRDCQKAFFVSMASLASLASLNMALSIPKVKFPPLAIR